MQEECEAINRFFQNTAYIEQNPQVAAALRLKKRETQIWLNYYLAIEPLKQGRTLICIQRILSHPGVIKHSLFNLPQLISRRYQNFWMSRQVNYHKSVFKV
jgi:hypothetical protein